MEQPEFGPLLPAVSKDETRRVAVKLHEICINHQLAVYLINCIKENFPFLARKYKLYADIEFNRRGINEKDVMINNESVVVRPDIIVHNRKDDADGFNFLVVECKKSVGSIDFENFVEDQNKIRVLMDGAGKYRYCFGLQVIYGDKAVCGKLFYHEPDGYKITGEEMKKIDL